MTTQEAMAPTSEGPMTATPAYRTLVPPVDVFENDEHYLILADLPGVRPDGLKVELDAPELTIEARAAGGGQKGKAEGSDDEIKAVYARTFEVPETLDNESVEAKLTDGVLRITLKKSANARRRQIAIQAG